MSDTADDNAQHVDEPQAARPGSVASLGCTVRRCQRFVAGFRLAASAAVLARAEEAAGLLAAALATVSELSPRRPELIAQRYPWICFLPGDARQQFVREYVETLQVLRFHRQHRAPGVSRKSG